MQHPSFYKVSWGQVEEAADYIATMYRGQITSVYGEPRGGLTLAVMISHKLRIPLVSAFAGEECLWVDDIIDSGQTWFKAQQRGFKLGAAICRRAGINNAALIETDAWVVFPWESEEDAALEESEYVARQ